MPIPEQPNYDGLDTAMADRLRLAIKDAGGNALVSERSGVQLRNLSRYLEGRDMKRTTLVALADACNVSLEWLATGRGTKEAAKGRMANLNSHRLEEALCHLQQTSPKSAADQARLLTLIYDTLAEAADTPDKNKAVALMTDLMRQLLTA